MSAAVRNELAAAANTVSGIRCSPYFTNASTPGQSFVHLDHWEYPNRFGAVAYWDVVVVLPQDQAQAEKYIEAKVHALTEALSDFLEIERVTPQQVSFPNAGVVLPALFISGNREA